MDINCILNRRSVRKYTDKQISNEAMQTILKAGMFAPSAHNSQPWEFIVIKDKKVLIELSKIRPYWSMLTQAAACIVVLANVSNYKSTTKEFFVQDCAASTQNILCAAKGLDIGSVWLGCYPVPDATAQVAKLLSIPDGITPFSIISLGYSDEEKHPHSSYREEIVHFDKY